VSANALWTLSASFSREHRDISAECGQISPCVP
jgi:hypothetical protein